MENQQKKGQKSKKRKLDVYPYNPEIAALPPAFIMNLLKRSGMVRVCVPPYQIESFK